MPDFTVSPVTQNHQTAVGKGIWHTEQVTSAGDWEGGVENEDHFKNQNWSLSSLLMERQMQILVILVRPSFLGWLTGQMISVAHMKGASRTPGEGMRKSVQGLPNEGGGTGYESMSPVSHQRMSETAPSQPFHAHRARLCWSGIYSLIKSQ